MGLLQFVACLVCVCGFTLSNCLPALDEKGVSISNSILSSYNGYHISSVSETDANGTCVSKVSLTGHGINKVINYPCNQTPQSIINLNKTVLLGNEYFSDTEGVLVRVRDDSCVKEVFTEWDGSFTSTFQTMNDRECEKVKIKIGLLKEQNDSWLEWIRTKQNEAYAQLAQLQNNLADLQHNFLGGIFGNFFG